MLGGREASGRGGELLLCGVSQIDFEGAGESDQVDEHVGHLLSCPSVQRIPARQGSGLIAREPLEEFGEFPTSPTMARISDFGSWN